MPEDTELTSMLRKMRIKRNDDIIFRRFVVSKIPPKISPYDIYKVVEKISGVEKFYTRFDSSEEVEITLRQCANIGVFHKLKQQLHRRGMKVQFTKDSPADFPGTQQVQLMFSPLNQDTAPVFFWQGPRRATFSEVLNTFCVKNIFKRLNAADLSEVSITCRRFNAIAKKVFKKIPEHQQHQYESVMLRPISQVESFFRQFGSNVTVLDTNKFQSQNVILGMVVRYCRNLKELQCTVCNQQTLTELKSIVGRLEKFDLLCSSDVVFYGNEMFTSCSPLRIWKLEHNGKTILPQIKLKHLFDLQLSSMYLPDEKTVCEFFKKNSQLQRLHLERVWTCSGFEHILWPLDNLEELTLFDFASRLYRSNSPCFEKMKRLSKLRLWAEVCDFNGILKVLNYSEVSVEYDRSMATTDNLTELDRSRMVTGLKLNKSFSSTHMYRGNWITNSMLEHAIQNLPGLQDFLVESVRISLDGILSTLEYGLRLRKAVFIIKKRVAMFAPHEHVLQLVSDIRVIAEIRKIQVSIEMVEEANSKPNVLEPALESFSNGWLQIKTTTFEEYERNNESVMEASLSKRLQELDIA